ncbi:MAG: transketolase C-terminal domain-containing protein [bacterium]
MADCEETPEIILMATGSEVQLALDVFEALKQEGVKARVVSMPAWNLFEKQSPEYRESVLPAQVRTRIAIEAGSTFGWEKFVGLPGDGITIGMNTFGASGKPDSLLKEFGLTAEAIVKTTKSLLKRV